MTVKELITQLLDVDMDSEVSIRVHGGDGCATGQGWDPKEIDGISDFKARPGVCMLEPRGKVYF